MDPQPYSPDHDDQAAQPPSVRTIASHAHDCDHLLNRWRIGRVSRELGAPVIRASFPADAGYCFGRKGRFLSASRYDVR